ncbi:hypothetical protein BDZ94DRAFT_1296462 [Collybia nuda]|uniref:Gustatory receptor n=1 Tax=Collybia nuda TaxID=64659 RepID=A0A9P6CKK5_9AGAR|nr:hypothetical protein BDZ94DRAFT_1296462 [Collybia nuda]
MSSLPLFSAFIVATNFIPEVAASDMNISPVNTATFSLYVVLAAYTVFQSIRALGILRRPHPNSTQEDKRIPPERVPYVNVFFATLTLIACYVLETIWIPIDLSKDSLGANLNNTFYFMLAADQLSDIFIASALLHFIDNQRDLLGRRHNDEEPTSTHAISSAKKKILDRILLSCMAIVAFAGLIVGTVVIRAIPNPDQGYIIYTGLYHAYIAMYFVTTLNVTLSAWFLWRGLSALGAPNEKITSVIFKHIIPLLIVRVLFKISVDTVTSVTSTPFDINYDVLGLIEAIVECVTYAAVLYMSLSLARPLKKQNESIKDVSEENA